MIKHFPPGTMTAGVAHLLFLALHSGSRLELLLYPIQLDKKLIPVATAKTRRLPRTIRQLPPRIHVVESYS